MKKIFYTFAALLVAGSAIAQEPAQKDKYRRSSLYTLMVLDTNVKGSSGSNDEEKAAIVKSIPALFAATPVPDKYDDHNLDVRTLTLENLPEVKIEKKQNALAGLGVNPAELLGIGGGKSDEEIVASLQEYFKANHVANKMVNKWYDAQEQKYDNGTHFTNEKTLYDRSANAVTEDEARAYQALNSSDRERLRSNIATDLLNKTFVMVNLYTYKSAEEIKDLVTAGLTEAAGSKANNPLGKKALDAAISKALAGVKGYMCCYKTYLFRLNYDDNKFNSEYLNYTPLEKFTNSDAYALDYIGKTSGMKPVVSFKAGGAGDTERLLGIITQRTIDESVVNLQKEYDDFKTLATLHKSPDGKGLIAYIGTKEGLKGGEKFEVLEKQMSEDGVITYKAIGNVSVEKGKVWNNVAGADEAGLKDLEEGDGANAFTEKYTVIKGDPKKFAGYLIRQKK